MMASTGSNQAVKTPAGAVQEPRQRTIHSCNFRYAGRLSNENARTLTALHEKFALNVTTSLELYLGATLHLKLVSLEQMAIVDYVGTIAPNSYMVPCSLNVLESNVLIEMDTRTDLSHHRSSCLAGQVRHRTTRAR
jgi:flagellar motor switch protein FliM